VDNIFSDYNLLECNWHAVVFERWSVENLSLRRALGHGYAKWMQTLFKEEEDSDATIGYDGDEDAEEEAEERKADEIIREAMRMPPLESSTSYSYFYHLN
jgi:hypothetical protein